MAATSEVEDKILTAAIEVMASRPWPKVALADIARAADLSIGTVYRTFSSRREILCALHRRIDWAMLDNLVVEGSARDRIFDLLMRRFDALATLKPAFRTGVADLRKGSLSALEPGILAALNLGRGMRIVLDVAGVHGSCVETRLRTKILKAVYLAAFRVWLDDDSEDLASTMAALDKALDRAASFLRLPESQPEEVNGGTLPDTLPI